MRGDFRFNNLLSICLFLILAGSMAAAEPPAAQPPKWPLAGAPDLVTLGLAKDHPEDDEMRKLLKARYRAAAGAWREALTLWIHQRSSVQEVTEVAQDLMSSGLELCDDPADKVHMLRQFIRTTEWAEGLLEQRRRVGLLASSYELYRVRYLQLDAKINLFRAERDVDESEGKD